MFRIGDAFKDGPKMSKILQVNIASELVYKVVGPWYPGDSRWLEAFLPGLYCK